jgi:hypothetical protein
MDFPAFQRLVESAAQPVILLEGTRALPEAEAGRLAALAAWLAAGFPHLRFRTGNAPGSDAAFAAGVAAIDPARLEFVLPYAGHRASQRPAAAAAIAFDDLPDDRIQEMADLTVEVSPALLKTRKIKKRAS